MVSMVAKRESPKTEKALEQMMQTNKRFLPCVELLVACVMGNFALLADDADPVVRIEEEWELVTQTPDSVINAPQIVMTFSPFGNVNGYHATLEMNHISSVWYMPGGLHLSTWNGENHIAVKHEGDYGVMSTESETVRWTQVMEFDEEQLIFKIKNGTSTTWGAFGGDDFNLSIPYSSNPFANYSAELSLQKSGVSYAENRVRSLILKKTRTVRASGETTEDSTPRVAHQYESNAAAQ
jgi:hypothetical protein